MWPRPRWASPSVLGETGVRSPTTRPGIAALVAQMQQLNPAALVLEATGGLELPLVAALAAASLPVVVVNPSQVRDFARATGRLAKTDSLDAAVLAHFAEAVRPPRRPLRDAETQVLSSLVARRQQVMTMLVAERNRLSSAAVAVRPSIEAHIAWLKQSWTTWTRACARPSARVRYGGRRTTCCAAYPGTRHRRPDISDPSGIPARTGHSQPPADRRGPCRRPAEKPPFSATPCGGDISSLWGVAGKRIYSS